MVLFKRLAKKAAVLLTILLISWSAYSQTYDRNFQDGKLYFKFKDDIAVNLQVNPDKSVNLDEATFLWEMRQNYDIKSLIRPFDLNNDQKLLRTFLLEFSQFDQVEEIAAELALNQDLEYVEKVPLSYPDYVPNDSLYNFNFGSNNWNWHLDVIHAIQAWDITTGSPDINVAIVDNAVWKDHPDLAEKIVLSYDVTAPPGGNNSSNPPVGGDPEAWSHGTHCAGLAAGHTDNEIGIASIGFNVSLIGVKATSNPDNISNGYGGMNWAANNGADVISMSWGNNFYSQSEQNLVTAAYNMGVVLLASAGNDNVSSAHYPSGYQHVISVASTDEDDVKSWFSNYGSTIDICAPGGDGIPGPSGLLSTTWDETSWGYYDTYFGTSMATPVAAGLCGLILSLNPELTPDEVEAVLESTCVNIDTIAGNSSYAGQLGAGRIDAYAAVLNTPYAPTASFMTPVPYITPGTTVQFTDMSTGVPSEWFWEFTGGTPTTSNNQNPEVTYNTEGVYNVSLFIANDFGDDLLTVQDYITVTSTPVPWVLFSADSDYTCTGETVSFFDESLYEPTQWQWEFAPETVTFMEGTTAASQNPVVRFDAPGYYTVTLTATNANGSGDKTYIEMIFAEGIELNYEEDFESGDAGDLLLTNSSRGTVKVDKRSSTTDSEYGLHFQGGGIVGGWSGGPANTTPEQAWETNTAFQAMASNCSVDATGVEGIRLTLDLRQTFSIGTTYSWFRVLVNGEQVSDVNGKSNFNPSTNTDPFETLTFDLSAFGNSAFDITFQSSCYLADGFNGLEGDNVFVDNIMISNVTGIDGEKGLAGGVVVYPNPVRGSLSYSASGMGSDFTVELLNVQGQRFYQETVTGYSSGQTRKISVASLPSGIYFLKLVGTNNTVSKKIVVE